MATFDPNDPRLKGTQSISEASSALGQNISTSQMKDIINARQTTPAVTPTATPTPPVTSATGAVTTPRTVIRPKTALEQAQEARFSGLNAPSESDIRQQELERARALIQATEGVYQEELGRLTREGQSRLQETSSIAVGAGLAGSPFQQTLEEGTRQGTNRVLEAQRKARQAEIADIMNKAESGARQKFLEEREFFTDENEARIEFLAGQQDRARDTVTNLAKGGISLDEIEKSDFTKLLEDTGLTELELRAVHNANLPQGQKETFEYKELKDGTFLQISSDGITTVLRDAPPVQDGFTMKSLSDGTLVQQNDTTGEIITVGNFAKPTVGSGTASKTATTKAKQNEAQKTVLTNKINLIDSLLASEGLKGSVGAFGVSRFTPFKADKSARKEFAAGVQQLISQETLDTLIDLKSRGGTLGALSETELDILKNSATKINSWVQKKDGEATGKFEVGEAEFKAELNKIKESTKKVIDVINQDLQETSSVSSNDVDTFLDSI